MRLLAQSRRDREADITIPPAVFLLLQSASHGRARSLPAPMSSEGAAGIYSSADITDDPASAPPFGRTPEAAEYREASPAGTARRRLEPRA